MPEYFVKHFELPKFTTPVSGMLKKVNKNVMKTGDKIPLHGLGTTKVKSGGVSMMLKTGTEMAQYYTVFNYITPRTQKDINYK